MTAADLTVIVVSFQSKATIALCLRALESQTTPGFRVLLVDSSSDCTAEMVQREFPATELIRSERRLFPGDARNLALSRTDTPLVAFVDADCVAAPDWVERILAAHGDPRYSGMQIIGGSVGVANSDSLAGWALYFSEFSNWMPVGNARRMEDIPTCCLSFKREAFERFGPFLEGAYCSDTWFNWKANRGGETPLFIPQIHVRHHNPANMGKIISKLRMHGATFARVRVEHHQWSRATAAVRAFTWFLLPGWLWLRTGFRVSQCRGYRARFLLATPLLWLALTSWSWGEATGYWQAARKSV